MDSSNLRAHKEFFWRSHPKYNRNLTHKKSTNPLRNWHHPLLYIPSPSKTPYLINPFPQFSNYNPKLKKSQWVLKSPFLPSFSSALQLYALLSKFASLDSSKVEVSAQFIIIGSTRSPLLQVGIHLNQINLELNSIRSLLWLELKLCFVMLVRWLFIRQILLVEGVRFILIWKVLITYDSPFVSSHSLLYVDKKNIVHMKQRNNSQNWWIINN